MVGAWASDLFGRKWLIACGLVVTYASVTVEVVATTMPVFFAGKTANGIALGIYASVAVTYISEVNDPTGIGSVDKILILTISQIAPHPLRGVMTALVALAFVFGPFIVTLIVNGTGTESSRWAYRAVFCAQYGVAFFSTIAWPFMPESPWWLMSKNRVEDAVKTFRRFGKSEIHARNQVALIQRTLDESRRETAGASYLECFRRSNLRRTIISIAPLSIQAFCGITWVINYTAYYLQLAGYSAHQSFQIQIAQVVVCMIGNIHSWFLIDRFGRRPVTIYGLAALTTMLLLTGGLATVRTHSCTVGTVALLVLYCWVYNLTIGATAYALVGETSTPRLRAKTVAIGLTLQNGLYLMWAFVLPYLFNPDKANLGARVTFIFGGLSVLSLVYLWFYQPETANRSFQELDEMFVKKVPARKFKGYQTEVGARSY